MEEEHDKIDSLVSDIQGLFDTPHRVDAARAKLLGSNLGEMVSRRLSEERGDAYLRMSNLGKGDRQLWYDILGGGKPEELNSSTKTKFLFGDILELLLIFLADEAGHEVTRQQEEINVNGVLGHIDAVIDGWVVDCKSASSIAFQKFKSGKLQDNDSFGYLSQLAGYVEGVPDAKGGAFLVIDKTLGHITLDKYHRSELEPYRIRDRIDHIQDVLSRPDELPERCYEDKPDGESGNRVLGTNCNYCSHKFECWRDANDGFGLRTFLYSNGPRYFTKVLKEPKVQELEYGR